MVQLHFPASIQFEETLLAGVESAFSDAAKTVVLRRKGERGIVVKGQLYLRAFLLSVFVVGRKRPRIVGEKSPGLQEK